MDFLDMFFWIFAVFAVVYGILLLVLPKKTLIPVIEKQLEKKGGASEVTAENVEKKVKMFRICGVICIVASGVLFWIQATGGILG